MIKARFVPMNAYGKRAAVLHLSYVERDGVEQDGGVGSIYGPAEASDVRATLSAPMEDEKRQFRFIGNSGAHHFLWVVGRPVAAAR